MKRLIVRVDANADIGFGHAVRCARLLRVLRTPVRPIVIGNGTNIQHHFDAADVVPLADRVDWRRVIEGAAPDAIMVDLPRRAERPWQIIRSVGVPVAAIDDEGGRLDADLVINGTVLDEFHRYEGLPASCRLLTGPEFALIDPVFALQQWSQPSDRSVVIVIGSGKRARDWAFLLARDGLRRAGCGSVTMVVGSGFAEFTELGRVAREAAFDLRQGITAREMADEFARSAVAITTGGMAVYEALAVGIPLIAFPQMENLKPEMAWFAARDCLTDLGYDGGMDMTSVTAALIEMLDGPAIAATRSRKGRTLIDGRGMRRAAQALDQFLTSR
jgi:spore coat polysaccharide biosynthesis predicted glycosyltransferase SpsG